MTTQHADRRQVTLGLAAVLALLGLPLVAWWRSSRLRPEAAEWGDLGAPGELPEGRWVARTLTVAAVDRWRRRASPAPVYVRREGRRLTLLSALCPHQGCPVQAVGEGFLCRCHDSAFDAEGEVLSGPSPRGLERLPWRVEKGRLQGRPAGATPDQDPA